MTSSAIHQLIKTNNATLSIRDGLREAFKIYDTDFDGFIDKKDILDFVALSGAELDSTVLEETIDLETFLNLFDFNLNVEVNKESVHNAFLLYDKDNTGKILVCHFISIMNAYMGDIFMDGDIDEVLKELDIDEQEHINYTTLLDLIK